MKSAYLAICYACNQNCKFCPCSKMEKQAKMLTDINNLKQTIDDLDAQGITDVTLSGGEPTLHPHLADLIAYIQSKKMLVTVLSNSERFSSNAFIADFVSKVDVRRLKVITTLHASTTEGHETANQTPGSFIRTVHGLKNLSNHGIRVIVKHCISKENYQELYEFFEYCNNTFDESVDIQLCSIDYCGMPADVLAQEKLCFSEVRPFIERMFDRHMELKEAGNKRKLYCINMPLCVCDVYYWRYLPRRHEKTYDQYKDPHNSETTPAQDNVGIHPKFCSACKVAEICCGTYFTAYDACGPDIVTPIL